MKWQDEQAAFWRWVVEAPDTATENETESVLAPHEQLSTRDALGIYQNAYRGRLLQAASELYPVTYYTLGDEAHNQLWLGYLAEHPPSPGPMSQLGNDLLSYCQQHKAYQQLPALLELVELETRLVELFESADVSRYTRSDLQNNPADNWATLSWDTSGDWTLMSVQFDLETYWLKMQDYRQLPDAKAGDASFAVPRFEDDEPRQLLIRRQDYKMHFQQISPTFAGFITRIRQGEDFAALCEYMAWHYRAEDVPVKSLNYLLQAIDLGLLHQQYVRE